MELLNGGKAAGFSSLRARDAQSALLNLEEGDVVTNWGRLIFHVSDVDAFWSYHCDKGLRPDGPRDASWGETLLSPVRSRWARAVICSAAAGGFQQGCGVEACREHVPWEV
jgi:hypothetical protein